MVRARFRCCTLILLFIIILSSRGRHVISKCVIVFSVRLTHYRYYWHRLVIYYFFTHSPFHIDMFTRAHRLAFVTVAQTHDTHICNRVKDSCTQRTAKKHAIESNLISGQTMAQCKLLKQNDLSAV